jgi:hypothetical protein
VVVADVVADVVEVSVIMPVVEYEEFDQITGIVLLLEYVLFDQTTGPVVTFEDVTFGQITDGNVVVVEPQPGAVA